jgi:hypothetical protein
MMDELSVPDFPVLFVPRPRLAAWYRKDVASQERFERFLTDNHWRLFDAYWDRQWLTVH